MSGAAMRTSSSDVNDKTPPQDSQAEASLLGGLFLGNEHIDSVMTILRGQDFYDKRNREIFDAIVWLHDHQSPVDLVTVTDELVKRGKIDFVGGRSYVIELTEDIYSAANCERYAEIIREKSLSRHLMKMCSTSFKRSQEGNDPKEVIASLEGDLFKLLGSSRTSGALSFEQAGELYHRYLDELMQARDHPEKQASWVTTGLADLDRIFFRWLPGSKTLIAGRPGDGKTALALKVMDHLDRMGVASAIFSLEMSPEEIMERFICLKTRIEADRLRRGQLSDDEYRRVLQVDLAQSKIYMDCCNDRDVGPFEIRSKARRLILEHNIKLVVIDYVQLMRLPGFRPDQRTAEMSEISRLTKGMARELQVPVLELSQMNRNQDSRADKEPELSDLRDTGALEQDAHNVVFAWHPYRKDKKLPNNVATLLVKKQRGGPLGEAKVWWNGPMVTFENITQQSAF